MDPRDDMDSYQELCYEVGLDLEPNKYAKLRKQAMLAQEEQNDPMPWPLLFIDELCLKMKDKLRRGKREELMDSRPPRKAIRQIEDLGELLRKLDMYISSMWFLRRQFDPAEWPEQ